MAAVRTRPPFQKGDTFKFKQTSTSVEVQPDDNISTDGLIPIHPSVMRLGEEENESCTIYGATTLSSLLRDYNVDYDYKRCIFLQIVYALIFMQEYPGNSLRDALNAEKIYFSHDCRYVTVGIHKRESGCPSKAAGVKLLKRLFRQIFLGDSSAAVHSAGNLAPPDQKITLDIENNIAKGSKLKGLLKHPFFWSYEKKLHFLIHVLEKIKQQQQQQQEFNSKSIDWIKALALSEKRVEQLAKRQISVKTSEIQDVASKKKNMARVGEKEKLINEYNTSKRSDLLRFIRNHKIHFEQSEIKDCFRDDSKDYWLFFSGRFPDFFMYVYDFAKNDLFIGSHLQSEYFDTTCPYSFLTDFKEPEKKVALRTT